MEAQAFKCLPATDCKYISIIVFIAIIYYFPWLVHALKIYLYKMKKVITLLSGILILILQPDAKAQDKADNKSLLWKISGNGLTKPSYLFGTIHQICQSDYFWTDKMKSSLDACDKICLEMNMDDPNMMTQVTSGLINTSGKTLQDYFTPSQYQLVKKYMKDTLGMDIAAFAQMKPVMLEMLFGLKDIKCDSPVAYEEKIMATAHVENKEILGLENVKEQLDVLESTPIDTVVKQLLDVVEHTDSDNSEIYDKMVILYKQQDLPALYDLIKSSKELGDDMNAFLDTRNKKWIPRMAEKMKSGSVFFAVGAGHLWGGNGVINLLRKEGYTVQEVK